MDHTGHQNPQEEGEYEWASYHHDTEPASEEGHVEPAVLVQPLNREEAGNGERATTFSSPVPLCQADGQGPCAHLARGGEGTHKKHNYHHEVVPSGGDTFCQAAGVPGLIRAVAGSPIGVFIAVGCAAKGVYELAGGH